MVDQQPCVVILTHGKQDNGKAASLAFSCGLSGLTLGMPATIFLTGDGVFWGYNGSAEGITAKGFPNLKALIQQYVDLGGRILLCSACHKACSSAGPAAPPTSEPLPSIEMAGFTTMLELAAKGVCVSF